MLGTCATFSATAPLAGTLAHVMVELKQKIMAWWQWRKNRMALICNIFEKNCIEILTNYCLFDNLKYLNLRKDKENVAKPSPTRPFMESYFTRPHGILWLLSKVEGRCGGSLVVRQTSGAEVSGSNPAFTTMILTVCAAGSL